MPVIHWSEKPYDDRFYDPEGEGWVVSIEPTETSYGSKSKEHPVFRHALEMLTTYVSEVSSLIQDGEFASVDEEEEVVTIGQQMANQYSDLWETYGTDEWHGEGDREFVKELIWKHLWIRFGDVIQNMEALFPEEHQESRRELGLIDEDEFTDEDPPMWG